MSNKIPDRIFILEKKNSIKRAGDIPDAVVVNSEDKEALLDAAKWGGKVSDRDMRFHEMDNGGFQVEIEESFIESFESSSIMSIPCIVAKGGKKYRIQFDSSMVFRAMMQSNTIQGEFEEDMSIYYRGGKVGIVHKDMPEYLDAQSARESTGIRMGMKKNMKRRIDNLEVGKSYLTLNRGSIYLGDIYSLMSEEAQVTNGQIHTIEIEHLPIKYAIFPCLIPDKCNGLYIDEEASGVLTIQGLYNLIEHKLIKVQEPLKGMSNFSWKYECLYSNYCSNKRPQAWGHGEYRLEADDFIAARQRCMNILKQRLNDVTPEDIHMVATLDFAMVARIVLSSTGNNIEPISMVEMVILRFLYRLCFRKYRLGPNMARTLRITDDEQEKMKRAVNQRISSDARPEYAAFVKELNAVRK